MKTTHLSHRVFGYTISELLVGSTVCAVLAAGMFTTISALRKQNRASEHHAQGQIHQARLIDYISRDLRRAQKVTVDTFNGTERLKLTIPNFYDSAGEPREPIIENGGVRYGEGEIAITYYMTNNTVFRTEGASSTALASGLEKFEIDFTDDGKQAITVAISFMPRFQYSDEGSDAARLGTSTFATTLLRNKRQ